MSRVFITERTVRILVKDPELRVSDYFITLTDNKMCPCAFLYFKDFLVLTFSRERKISVDIAHIYKSSSEFLSNS